MDQVAAMLQELAATLGVAVEHLWGAIVYQAQLGGLRSLMWAALIVIGVVAYHKKTKRWILEMEEDSVVDQDFNEVFAHVCGFFLIVLGTPLALNNLYWAIVALANPEYLALHWLLGVLS